MDYVRTKSKPAVVNCLTDPDVLHEIWAVLGLFPSWGLYPGMSYQRRVGGRSSSTGWSVPISDQCAMLAGGRA